MLSVVSLALVLSCFAAGAAAEPCGQKVGNRAHPSQTIAYNLIVASGGTDLRMPLRPRGPHASSSLPEGSIPLPRKSKKRRLIWLLLGLAVLAASLFPLFRKGSPQKVRLASVVKAVELRQVVNGSGEIRTEDSIDIQAEIAGVIVDLPVREGDRVHKGQVLLKIDPFQTDADVQASRFQLSALEAEAAGQDFQIATSEANMARDEFLKKSAEVELRQAETNLARSQVVANREKELLASSLISPDQYEITETQLKLNQAQIEAAQAKIDQLTAQGKAGKAQIEFARASREAVLRRVEGARSSLLRSEDLFKKTTITSTIDGVIVKLNVEAGERAVPGNLSNPQATLMTIADFSIIEAELRIDETDIVHVKLEDPAKVLVDALSEISLSGQVIEIGNSPIASASSGQGGGGGSSQEGKDFKVIVRIIDPPAALRPGMSCEADITTAVKKDAIVLPIQALTLREAKVDADGKYIPEVVSESSGAVRAATADSHELKELQGVFLVLSSNRATFQPVKTGITGEMDIEALDGLSLGQEVIVGPLKALRSLKEGDPIEIDREHPYRRAIRRRTASEEDEKERP